MSLFPGEPRQRVSGEQLLFGENRLLALHRSHHRLQELGPRPRQGCHDPLWEESRAGFWRRGAKLGWLLCRLEAWEWWAWWAFQPLRRLGTGLALRICHIITLS